MRPYTYATIWQKLTSYTADDETETRHTCMFGGVECVLANERIVGAHFCHFVRAVFLAPVARKPAGI